MGCCGSKPANETLLKTSQNLDATNDTSRVDGGTAASGAPPEATAPAKKQSIFGGKKQSITAKSVFGGGGPALIEEVAIELCNAFMPDKAGGKPDTCATCKHLRSEHAVCDRFDAVGGIEGHCYCGFRADEHASCSKYEGGDTSADGEGNCPTCGLKSKDHAACSKFAKEEGKDRCKQCGLPSTRHEVCRYYDKGDNTDDCKTCGLRWPDHEPCDKFVENMAEDCDHTMCITCGVPKVGHHACVKYDASDSSSIESPCSKCGLPGKDFHKVCPKIIDPTGKSTLCDTCGMPKELHPVCDTFEVSPFKGVCGTCGNLRDVHMPCAVYRVNLQAENFGDCMCTFPKAEHSKESLTKALAGKKGTTRRNSGDVRAGFVQKQYCDCKRYRVNLASSNFGECMCGRPKAEHSPEALAENADAGSMAGNTRRDSKELRSTFVQKEKADCPKFEPNLETGAYGECKCGRMRADHTDEALAAGTGEEAAHGKKKRTSLSVRAGFVQKEYVACEMFVLNTDPNAPFGMCMCGYTSQQHSDVAKDAGARKKIETARKTSETVRKEMKAKQTQNEADSIEAMGK